VEEKMLGVRTRFDPVTLAFDLDLQDRHLVTMEHISTGIFADINDSDGHDGSIVNLSRSEKDPQVLNWLG
jgi:hypothetical protein